MKIEETKCLDCGSKDLRFTDLVVRSYKVTGMREGQLILGEREILEDGEKPMIHCYDCGADWREEIWESAVVAEALESGFDAC